MGSPVPRGPRAPTLAFDRGPQDFGISCYDTVVEALVELGNDVAPVGQEGRVNPSSSFTPVPPPIVLWLSLFLTSPLLYLSGSAPQLKTEQQWVSEFVTKSLRIKPKPGL